jgi:light-regulated signal transduction histidine kinase (bacteriophytochrome)
MKAETAAERGVILIVDDTPTNLELLFDFLTQSGFRILVAEDGESAIQKANYAAPDLILLDILMPDMDGFETCRQLKASESTREIPVIFLTALTDAIDKVRGFNLGAVDYITKPLQYEEVLARVTTHLRLQRLTQQLQTQNLRLEQEIQERQQADLELQRQNRRSQLFAEVTLKIRQSLHIQDILQTTVNEVQAILQSDRVLVYRLWADGSGSGVAEAVLPGIPPVLGQTFPQEVFPEDYRERYRSGRIRLIDDVTSNPTIAPCLVEFVQQFKVRAKLIVPILVKEDLWGLLIAHQCSGPRQWTPFETELLQQLANQMGIALTQAQLLEQETRQRQELARSNAELQQFAYIASHDLQEPLRMVTSYLQLIERRYKGKLDTDADDFIAYAVDGAIRMKTLINDLLTYSRVGTRSEAFQQMNAAVAVDRAIANLGMAIDESHAAVTYDPLPEIMADASQLAQLFQNLIGNALKFHGQNSPIVHIQAIHQEDKWLFSVRDNGIGIDPEYTERIFALFQRLHNRAAYPGTGIGLAICKKIVERHGGQIWVDAKPNQGSTFYFTIPDRISEFL